MPLQACLLCGVQLSKLPGRGQSGAFLPGTKGGPASAGAGRMVWPFRGLVAWSSGNLFMGIQITLAFRNPFSPQ